MMRRERLAAEDTQECQSIGAQPGSKEYIDCRLRLKELRESTAVPNVMCTKLGNTVNCF